MGVVHLPDALQAEIDRQVAEGRAQSAAEFVEEAVRRMIEDLDEGQDELAAMVQRGISDIESGRYVTLETEEDWDRLHERAMARVRARLAQNDPEKAG